MTIRVSIGQRQRPESSHSRSRSPSATRSPTYRSRSQERTANPERAASPATTPRDTDGEERGRSATRTPVEDDTPADMISLMGFAGFGSTKGKHIEGTKGGAATRARPPEYRQYMNRAKGFNRPLSPPRKP
ncbi:hypothetical protein ABC855_g2783 [[Candida] zeylanoides]